MGAAVIEEQVVGAGAFVAAGAVVINDVEEGCMVAGVPAVLKNVLASRGKPPSVTSQTSSITFCPSFLRQGGGELRDGVPAAIRVFVRWQIPIPPLPRREDLLGNQINPSH